MHPTAGNGSWADMSVVYTEIGQNGIIGEDEEYGQAGLEKEYFDYQEAGRFGNGSGRLYQDHGLL